MNETCSVWISHITCKLFTSHTTQSCHVGMSHVTLEWVVSHMNASCRVRMSNDTCEWVMLRMKESRHVWVSHVTYDTTYKCVMSLWCHIWMGHVIYESVMSHVNQSCMYVSGEFSHGKLGVATTTMVTIFCKAPPCCSDTQGMKEHEEEMKKVLECLGRGMSTGSTWHQVCKRVPVGLEHSYWCRRVRKWKDWRSLLIFPLVFQ